MEATELFAQRVKERRLELGLTQADVAERLGVTLQSIYGYETGGQFPRAEVFNSMCKLLKMKPFGEDKKIGDKKRDENDVAEITPIQALSVLCKHFGRRIVKA